VLLPESLAALRAARLNRLQTSMNLALGLTLASIGLTISTVAFVSIAITLPLALGLGKREEVLLSVTLLISVLTLGTGRTIVLQGVVHLVTLATFLFSPSCLKGKRLGAAPLPMLDQITEQVG